MGHVRLIHSVKSYREPIQLIGLVFKHIRYSEVQGELLSINGINCFYCPCIDDAGWQSPRPSNKGVSSSSWFKMTVPDVSGHVNEKQSRTTIGNLWCRSLDHFWKTLSCLLVFLKVLFMSPLFIPLSGMNHYTAAIRHIHVHFWMKTSVVKLLAPNWKKTGGTMPESCCFICEIRKAVDELLYCLKECRTVKEETCWLQAVHRPDENGKLWPGQSTSVINT